MAGHSRYTAVLDACTLYSTVTADSLMSLAVAGLFAPKWTVRIEQEWMDAVVRGRPDLEGRLDYRRDRMREATPDWEVSMVSVCEISKGLTLPDADDVHVLAAAIGGHADCIVTWNLKDFPSDVLEVHGIEAVDPDSFIIAQWDLDTVAAIEAFKRMRGRWRSPSASPEELANRLERAGLPFTADKLREAASLI